MQAIPVMPPLPTKKPRSKVATTCSTIQSEPQQAALNALDKLGGKPVVLREDGNLSNKVKISLASDT